MNESERHVLSQALRLSFIGVGAESQQARHYLERFQNTLAAWNIVEFLVVDSTPEVQFFAASCLKHKIMHDLAQLDSNQVGELKRFLLSLTQFPSTIVNTQISLARAALTVQSGEYDLLSEQNDLSSLGVIPEMLSCKSIPSTYPPSLEIIERIVQILLQSGNFASVSAWLDCISTSPSDIMPGYSLISSPDFLRQLFEHWVSVHEVLAKVIQLNVNTSDPNWLHMLDSQIGILGQGHNHKLALPVAVALGECFLDRLLMNNTNFNIIIKILLEGGINSPVASDVESTLNVWDNLAEQAYFPEIFSTLLQHLMQSKHLRYPLRHLDPSQPGEEAEDEQDLLDAEALHEFREFRHILGDTIKTCVTVLGSTQALCLVQKRFLDCQGISERESLMFALRTMASAVDRRECEVLPVLLENLLFSRVDTEDNLTVRYSKNLLIGAYAEWVVAQGRQWVHRFVGYLMASFALGPISRRSEGGLDLPAVHSMAARALMYIAESDQMSDQTFFPIDLYFGQLLSLLQPPNVLIDSQTSMYLICTLGLLTCHSELQYSQIMQTIMSDPGRFLSAYGSLLKSLETNDLLTDQVVKYHVNIMLPYLEELIMSPRGFVWKEDYLEALGTFLLEPTGFCSVVLHLYCQHKLAAALSLLVDERCRPHLSTLLETVAAHFIPDSAPDFCSAILLLPTFDSMNHYDKNAVNSGSSNLGPLSTNLLMSIAKDPHLSAMCALQLSDLVYSLPLSPLSSLSPSGNDNSLLYEIVETALVGWPTSNVSELGRSLWRRFKITSANDSGISLTREFFERLMNKMIPDESKERMFYLNLCLKALQDTRPRAMKHFLINLADLIRRRQRT